MPTPRQHGVTEQATPEAPRWDWVQGLERIGTKPAPGCIGQAMGAFCGCHYNRITPIDGTAAEPLQ